MRLAKKLCEYGKVLYVSAEEGIRQSFQRRTKMFNMEEVKEQFFVIVNPNIEALKSRLAKTQESSICYYR